MGPGFSKADKRPLLITILDPFNIYGIVAGKGMVLTKFWEEYQPIYNGNEGDARLDRHGLQPVSSREVQHEDVVRKT